MSDRKKTASAIRRHADRLRSQGNKQVSSGRTMQAIGGAGVGVGAAMLNPAVSGFGGAALVHGANETHQGQKKQKRGRFMSRVDKNNQKSSRLKKARDM